MNSFYASVEMAYDPSLKGRPLAIAGNAKERKGIVVTCSYEARARGVKPPMPLWEAKRLKFLDLGNLPCGDSLSAGIISFYADKLLCVNLHLRTEGVRTTECDEETRINSIGQYDLL